MTLSPKLVAAVLAFVPALSFSQGNTVNDSFNKAKQYSEIARFILTIGSRFIAQQI